MRSRRRGNITYGSHDGKPRDDRASEIGSIPVPLGSRFQFSLDPLSRLARICHLAFVEQAKLHSAGGCNFAARIRQTGIRLFDPHCDKEEKRERERERRETGAGRGRLQQVVKYERRVVRFKHHLCLSIKFTRLSFQRCASCHFASPISVSYSCSDSRPSSSHNYTLRSATRFVSFRSSCSGIPRDRSNYLVSSSSFLQYLRMSSFPPVGTNFSTFSLAIARCYATRYELPAINVKTFAFTVPPGLPAKLATYHDPTHSLYAPVGIHFRGILLRVRNECNVNGKT